MTMPDEAIAITGTMTDNLYTITFYDKEGGNVVGTITRKYNETVDASNIKPTSTKYAFVGWKTSVPGTMPAENISIVADWTIKTFTIVFKNYDGTVLQTIKNVEYGTEYGTEPFIYTEEEPTRSSDNEKGSYVFNGWSPAWSPATANVTYTAQFLFEDITAPVVQTVTINDVTVYSLDEDGNPVIKENVECIEKGTVKIAASDNSDEQPKIVYTINDGESQDCEGQQFTFDNKGDVVIKIKVSDKDNNFIEFEINAIVRKEAKIGATESTYTQLSGKQVAMVDLDLDGAVIDHIEIDGQKGSDIWDADNNCLKSSVLDNLSVGKHTAKIFTKLNDEPYSTDDMVFDIDVKGFEVEFEQEGAKKDGYCSDETAEIILTFDEMDRYPTHYKIEGLDTEYKSIENLAPEIGKIRIAIQKDMPLVDGHLNISFAYSDGNPNTVSEVKPLSVFMNLSGSEYIIKLFDDMIAINNHDDIFTEYQWYKNGVAIDQATQQYYQVDKGEKLSGVYSAYVTRTDGTVLKVCSLDMGEEEIDLSKSLKRSVNAYPNPARANEEITLELLNYDEAEYDGCVIKIVNGQGAIVATIDNCSRINTVSLPSGTYTGYVIRSGKNGDRVSFKLIVK